MTIYLIDCRKCTNSCVNSSGQLYCSPGIQGLGDVYIVPGHAGTKEDPDPINCDFFCTDEHQLGFYEVFNTK